MINAGVYRDGHICEPAMAPLILHAMQNGDSDPAAVASNLFAFDVANGAGGLLTAFHTADSLLRSRSPGSALIVSGDIDPTPRLSVGCALDPLGAAVILERGNPSEGFVDFRFDTYPKHSEVFESSLRWVRNADDDPTASTLRFTVREGDEFLERAIECAVQSFERFLARRGADFGAPDLIIAADHPRGFCQRFAGILGIPPARIVQGPGAGYTAALAAGLSTALADGRFHTARRCVFVAVSAGITVSIADYRSDRG
jgi:3-oxoacyl-[acyl-carrier-protein] synthase III